MESGINGSDKESGWKDRKEWLMLLLSLLLAFIGCFLSFWLLLYG